MSKNQPGPRWLMQLNPTSQGRKAHPNWKPGPHSILIYTQDERTARIKEARQAMHRGEISAFRCDPV